MEGIFLGTSLLAAFVAGAVALFAPCCITVVFPAYLAAAVRNHRWRLVPLTLVFGAGVAVVLVPITWGLSLLTESLLQYSSWVYGAGAVLMLALAWAAVTGATWSLPFLRGAPDIARTDSAGVFALGVFSGAASACCAPVLAGVLTLSAVAPGALAATGVGLAYVLGMVFPMLLATLWWDRSRLAVSERLRGRRLIWRLGSRTYATTTVSAVAAAMFAVTGVVLAGLAVTGARPAPGFQVSLAGWLQDRFEPVVRALEPVPDLVVGLVLIGVAAAAVTISGRRRRPASPEDEASNPKEGVDEQDDDRTPTDEPQCH